MTLAETTSSRKGARPSLPAKVGWAIRNSPLGALGLGVILFWVAVAALAPWLAPYSPSATVLPLALPGAPSPDDGVFWLGTDHLGRDILSRLIFGARTVLTYAPLATACAYTVGILGGLTAGYLRGPADELLSRLGDLILAFPALVLYIVIISRFGASATNIVIAVTVAVAPGVMRIVRGLVLDLRNRAYVAAAELRGESALYIMLVEILPNARGPLIVDACLRLGYVTVTIGTLGFLGLGLPPPTPDWGGMINETRLFALAMPHMVVFPCLAVVSLVLGLNLFADGLRELSLKD